jgi:hypothetical protein
MNPRDALMLVREKYLEEQKGITSGAVADRYRQACAQFPAIMSTAHYLWAMEMGKGMPNNL